MKVALWTMMRASGAVEIFSGPASHASMRYDYLGVLDWIGRDMMTGGSTYDRPTLLFADGKQVELTEHLTDMGYRYVNEKHAAHEQALAAVNAKWRKAEFDEQS